MSGCSLKFFFVVEPDDPRLVHIRVVKALPRPIGRRANDLDGLERDFADAVAGLQERHETAILAEDSAIARAVKPLFLPAKRQGSFTNGIEHGDCLDRHAIVCCVAMARTACC